LTAEDRVCQNCTIIRDHAFPDEARENQHHAIEESIRVESALLLDLREQMPWPLYRTGNQVREQTDEETIIEERPGSLNPPFIDVHDIGDFLKRVKRNAWWKDDLNQRQRDIVNSKFFEGTQEGAREEVKVFENAQNREIQNEREDEPLPAVGVRAAGCDLLCDQEIHRGAANHEGEETPIPPSVEKVAGQEKENILSAVIETPVQQHDWYQEEKISRGVKEHGVKLNQCFHFLRSEPHAHKDIQTHEEETIS
jgi:hypothetical protein